MVSAGAADAAAAERYHGTNIVLFRLLSNRQLLS